MGAEEVVVVVVGGMREEKGVGKMDGGGEEMREETGGGERQREGTNSQWNSLITWLSCSRNRFHLDTQQVNKVHNDKQTERWEKSQEDTKPRKHKENK